VCGRDEVISPILAGGEGLARGWPEVLGAGLVEPRRGYRFRPESAYLAELLGQRSVPPPARIVDLGAGSGVLAVIAAATYPDAHVVAVERQPEAADRARRNLAVYAAGRAEVVCGDLRETHSVGAVRVALGGPADLVVTNPPWYPEGWGRPSDEASSHASTHALHGGVAEFLRVARTLLAEGGALWVVYDATRLADLLVAAGEQGFGMHALVWLPDRREGRGDEATRVWVELGRGGAKITRG
jgi:tRNA1(Val) A37 N6-methylase TrmN6